MRKEKQELTDISVVITTNYREKELRKVLESIFNLKYPTGNLDLTVVSSKTDKGAYENVHEFNSMNEKEIKLLTIESDNANKKRNEGIKNSEKEYVLLTDDDIILNPELLNNSLNLMKETKVAAVSFPVKTAYPTIQEKLHFGRFYGNLFQSNTVMPTTLLKKDIIIDAGLYREDMGPPETIHEDWELGSRLRKLNYKVLIEGKISNEHIIKTPYNLNQEFRSSRSSLLNSIIRYASSYLEKNYWSFFQVLKSSNQSQRIEYFLYFLYPILGFSLLFNIRYFLMYLSALLLFTPIYYSIRGYYSTYGLRERTIYPLILISVRTVRTYLSVIGLIIAQIKKLS